MDMYRQRTTGWLKHLDFILLDLFALQMSFLLACKIRHGWESPGLPWEYWGVNLTLICADLLVLFFSESLRDILRRGYWKELVQCAKSAGVVTLFSVFYLFSVQAGIVYSRMVCILTGGLYFLLNYLLRIVWKRFLQDRGNLRLQNAMLVAAGRRTMEAILKNLRDHQHGLSTIAGLVLLDEETQKLPEQIGGIPVVASRDTLEAYICRNWVDELLVVQDMEEAFGRRKPLQELLDRIAASGVAVQRVVDFRQDAAEFQEMVEHVGGYTVVTSVVRSVTFRQAFFKRTMDILGGLAGCVLAGIVLVVVGPMIYLQSPGPIIFKQQRIGRNGKLFTMYKLRSMVLDAEQRKQELRQYNRVADGMMFKLDFDPRIIGARQLPDGTIKKGIGNYIRDWSLDEVPQFWNVLKGDMSLVGTRPPTLDEWNKYALYHRARMAFRPGITGMWQVSGRSNITDFEEVVKLDLQYINEWTPGLDFRILLKTVQAVLKRSGSM